MTLGEISNALEAADVVLMTCSWMRSPGQSERTWLITARGFEWDREATGLTFADVMIALMEGLPCD